MGATKLADGVIAIMVLAAMVCRADNPRQNALEKQSSSELWQQSCDEFEQSAQNNRDEAVAAGIACILAGGDPALGHAWMAVGGSRMALADPAHEECDDRNGDGDSDWVDGEEDWNATPPDVQAANQHYAAAASDYCVSIQSGDDACDEYGAATGAFNFAESAYRAATPPP